MRRQPTADGSIDIVDSGDWAECRERHNWWIQLTSNDIYVENCRLCASSRSAYAPQPAKRQSLFADAKSITQLKFKFLVCSWESSKAETKWNHESCKRAQSSSFACRKPADSSNEKQHKNVNSSPERDEIRELKTVHTIRLFQCISIFRAATGTPRNLVQAWNALWQRDRTEIKLKLDANYIVSVLLPFFGSAMKKKVAFSGSCGTIRTVKGN